MNSRTKPSLHEESRIFLSIQKAMHFIIISAGCIMAATFFCVVILRYGFNANLFAYEEWLMVIAFWMFFIASAIATRDNVHINADILGIFIKQAKTAWIHKVTVKTIELIILIYLTYLGCLMITEEIAAYPMWQQSIALKIPFIVPRLGIAVGFFMMLVFTALHLVSLLKQGPTETSQSIIKHPEVKP